MLQVVHEVFLTFMLGFGTKTRVWTEWPTICVQFPYLLLQRWIYGGEGHSSSIKFTKVAQPIFYI